MAMRVSLFVSVILIIMFMNIKVNGKEGESPVYTQYVSEVTSSFLKEMYKQYGFECGASGGEMPYDVEEILVQLVAYRTATIEQARELEVKATEKFVQIINAHEKIRPFLREYPFPSSRARVTISFRKKRQHPTDGEVEFICHAQNKLYYLAHDPDHPYVGKDIKNEPYEEALRIVQGNEAKNNSQKSKNL